MIRPTRPPIFITNNYGEKSMNAGEGVTMRNAWTWWTPVIEPAQPNAHENHNFLELESSLKNQLFDKQPRCSRRMSIKVLCSPINQ